MADYTVDIVVVVTPCDLAHGGDGRSTGTSTRNI
jgi:hypothetical protein